MWEKLRVLVPGCLTLVLFFGASVAWAETDKGNIGGAGKSGREVVADDMAVLFLGREVIYDVGWGFCPNGYKEGNFDGEGDALDCRMKYLVAGSFPRDVSLRGI